MSGVALDSKNHILRDEITHARVLAWGRFAKIIPMSNPGPLRGHIGCPREFNAAASPQEDDEKSAEFGDAKALTSADYINVRRLLI